MRRKTFGWVLAGLLLGLLVLVGCGGGGSSEPDRGEAARVISGSVENYTGEPRRLAGINDDGFRIGAGQLRADGSFAFAYDRAADLDPQSLYLAVARYCDGFAISDSAARVVPDRYIAVMDGETIVGLLALASSYEAAFDGNAEGTMLDRIYADRDVTIAGTCADGGDTFAHDLKAGWNTVVATWQRSASGDIEFSAGTAPTPPGLRWFFRSR